jgi:hypothetical protein
MYTNFKEALTRCAILHRLTGNVFIPILAGTRMGWVLVKIDNLVEGDRVQI